MARTGTQENKDANNQYSAWQQDQVKRANAATDKYNSQLGTLEKGGSLAPDPFQNPTYLGNVNKLQSNALNSENDAAKGELEAWNRRTGGLNSSAVPATMSDLAMKKMRMADQLSAGRAADDYKSNLDWQRFILGSTLAPAGVDTSMFATSTGGRSGALDNLQKIGAAGYGPWNALIGAAGAAGGAAIGKIPCWIAFELYGKNNPRAVVIRRWLTEVYAKTFVGNLVVRTYVLVGEPVAWAVKRSKLLRAMFRPLFDKALRRALATA